ncbi:MAG: hypothetical protein JW922_01895 [Paludibacteraceae bacterium]|nr:hypothetical protein [Paludibacteraceae bacterium]
MFGSTPNKTAQDTPAEEPMASTDVSGQDQPVDTSSDQSGEACPVCGSTTGCDCSTESTEETVA